MLKLVLRKPSVVLNVQYWQSLVAFGFVKYPPAVEMYGAMYCEQVWPDGGTIVTSSTEEHSMGWRPSDCPSSASIR